MTQEQSQAGQQAPRCAVHAGRAVLAHRCAGQGGCLPERRRPAQGSAFIAIQGASESMLRAGAEQTLLAGMQVGMMDLCAYRHAALH